MTRTELVLYRNRRVLLLVAVLLTLGGGVALSLILIGREADARQEVAQEAQEIAREADLRGEAVSTLAGDVRALRAQVEAEGATPVAPDPTRAVDDLPDRAEVPVPIPGPRGAAGERGKPGEPGEPGRDGVDGSPGEAGPTGPAGPQGEPGVAGPPGPAGQDGQDGTDGRDGQTCPDGYHLEAPSYDPDALVCRKDGAPQPDEPGNGNQAAALDPQRRQYV